MIDLELDFRSKHDWYTDRLVNAGWIDAEGRCTWYREREDMIWNPEYWKPGMVISMPPGFDARWLAPSFTIGPGPTI